MSQIAEETGIGRATLYKYFPDVDSILVAWHERHVAGQLERLAALAREPGPPLARLEAVLEAFAAIESRQHGHEISALVHGAEHVARVEQHLHALLRGMVAEAARAGQIRDDVPPDELARYCLHALTAARGASSKTGIQRLVQVTLAGLRAGT